MTLDKKPVVVAVGGRKSDAAALAYGVAEARRRETSLELVHVVPGGTALSPMAGVALLEMQRVGREVLQRAGVTTAETAPDLDVRTTLRNGSPTHEIAHVGESAQLVIIGRSGRHSPRAAWSGRTAVGVSAHSHVPVLVVPDTAEPSETLSTVVVGLTADAVGLQWLGAALAEAVDRGATVTAVHAWNVPDPYVDIVSERAQAQEWEEDGTRIASEVLGEALPEGGSESIEVAIRHGSPARVLLEAAEDADLLVLPRRRHVLLHLGHLGSTARGLIHQSTTPVLVLPAPEPEHRLRRGLRRRHAEESASR